MWRRSSRLNSFRRLRYRVSTDKSYRALLPDIICFAYFKAGDLRVNAEGADKTNDIRQPEPDIYAPRNFLNNTDEEEHVLVLDFVETGNRNKPK